MQDLEHVSDEDKTELERPILVPARAIYEFCTAAPVYYRPDLRNRILLAQRLGLIAADTNVTKVQFSLYEKGEAVQQNEPGARNSERGAFIKGCEFRTLDSWFTVNPLLSREETLARLSSSKASHLAELVYASGGDIERARIRLYEAYERHLQARPGRQVLEWVRNRMA